MAARKAAAATPCCPCCCPQLALCCVQQVLTGLKQVNSLEEAQQQLLCHTANTRTTIWWKEGGRREAGRGWRGQQEDRDGGEVRGQGWYQQQQQ